MEKLDDNDEKRADIYDLFSHYNSLYFDDALGCCILSWGSDPSLISCTGACHYDQDGSCEIRLSEPLLKICSDIDIKNALLHEMIHAYLWIKHKNEDHSCHGSSFQEIRNAINATSETDHLRPYGGYNIPLHHEFKKEASTHELKEIITYKFHHYMCNTCGDIIRRTRKPSAKDCINKVGLDKSCGSSSCTWHSHKRGCSGSYSIAEPSGHKENSVIIVDQDHQHQKLEDLTCTDMLTEKQSSTKATKRKLEERFLEGDQELPEDDLSVTRKTCPTEGKKQNSDCMDSVRLADSSAPRKDAKRNQGKRASSCNYSKKKLNHEESTGVLIITWKTRKARNTARSPRCPKGVNEPASIEKQKCSSQKRVSKPGVGEKQKSKKRVSNSAITGKQKCNSQKKVSRPRVTEKQRREKRVSNSAITEKHKCTSKKRLSKTASTGKQKCTSEKMKGQKNRNNEAAVGMKWFWLYRDEEEDKTIEPLKNKRSERRNNACSGCYALAKPPSHKGKSTDLDAEQDLQYSKVEELPCMNRPTERLSDTEAAKNRSDGKMYSKDDKDLPHGDLSPAINPCQMEGTKQKVKRNGLVKLEENLPPKEVEKRNLRNSALSNYRPRMKLNHEESKVAATKRSKTRTQPSVKAPKRPISQPSTKGKQETVGKKRKGDGYCGKAHTVGIVWVCLYSAEEEDDTIEPLKNKRTERRNALKVLQREPKHAAETEDQMEEW